MLFNFNNFILNSHRWLVVSVLISATLEGGWKWMEVNEPIHSIQSTVYNLCESFVITLMASISTLVK